MTENTEQRIERVARALCEATGNGDPNRLLAWGKAAWSEWIDEARAADAISFAAGWDAAVEALRRHAGLEAPERKIDADYVRHVQEVADYRAAHRPGEIK